jgi:hypothetical protein
MKKLTPEQRSEIARKAVAARETKRKNDQKPTKGPQSSKANSDAKRA